MMILSMTVTTEALGLTVCAISICRLRHLHVVRYGGKAHHPGWVATYFCMALAGLLAFSEAHEGRLSAALLPALAACLSWLWLSRQTWKDGAPKYLERPPE